MNDMCVFLARFGFDESEGKGKREGKCRFMLYICACSVWLQRKTEGK